jgi:hypothetical protein
MWRVRTVAVSDSSSLRILDELEIHWTVSRRAGRSASAMPVRARTGTRPREHDLGDVFDRPRQTVLRPGPTNMLTASRNPERPGRRAPRLESANRARSVPSTSSSSTHEAVRIDHQSRFACLRNTGIKDEAFCKLPLSSPASWKPATRLRSFAPGKGNRRPPPPAADLAGQEQTSFRLHDLIPDLIPDPIPDPSGPIPRPDSTTRFRLDRPPPGRQYSYVLIKGFPRVCRRRRA